MKAADILLQITLTWAEQHDENNICFYYHTTIPWIYTVLVWLYQSGCRVNHRSLLFSWAAIQPHDTSGPFYYNAVNVMTFAFMHIINKITQCYTTA